MTAGVPWSVSAVDPETWDTAREAARHAGLSVGEWLQQAIRDNAGSKPGPVRNAKDAPRDYGRDYGYEALAERIDLLLRRSEPAAHAHAPAAPNHSVTASLDALTSRIDILVRGMERGRQQAGQTDLSGAIRRLDAKIETLFQAPPRGQNLEVETKLDEIARLIDGMSARLARETHDIAAPGMAPTAHELDLAVAEIIQRQAALDGVSLPRAPSTEEPPAYADGIERRLKHIAEEMETLRRASPRGDAVLELRRDIAELSRTMTELAPRRTLDALEDTVEALANRLDRAPASGDGRDNAAILTALDEIRGALAHVRPAESFASVEGDLNVLSNKLDVLNAKSIDGTTVARIQNQIAELRDLLANALPADALGQLVEQIEAMAAKVERSAQPVSDGSVRDVVGSLERRIDGLAERIEHFARPQADNDALGEIGARLDTLQQALNGIERPNTMGLEDAMRQVVDRLDASEAKLAGIGNIERNISDLSQEFSKARANAMDVAERAAKNALRELQSRSEAPAMQAAPAPRPAAAVPMPPVMAAPSIEPPMPPAAFERPLASESAGMPLQIRSIRTAAPRGAPESAPIPETAARFSRPGPVAESDELPADYPLEPGSGAPHGRQTPIAQRIAQSEAAVAEIAPKSEDAGHRATDYIAAARRAAQAAAAEANAEGVTPSKKFSVGALFARGRRALLLGLAVTMIAFGAVRFIDFGALNPFGGEVKTAPMPRKDAPAPAAPAPAPQTTPPATQSPEPPQQRSVLPGTVDPAAAVAPPAGNIAPQVNPSLLAQQPDASITNQIAPIVPQTRQQQASLAVAPTADAELPATIGNAALRTAALQGDPNAAIEIADRFLNGTGVTANAAEALRWLERAAAKGSPVAAFRVGMAYEKGQGTTKDRAQARTHYTLAAESGHVKAMHNLAVLITETLGGDGKPDFQAALALFRKAAEFGLRDSQYNLGVLYARGLGVPQNLTESYRWFSLAANQGDLDAAKKRDEVAARLDQQTLVAARLAVQTWQPQNQNEAVNASAPKPEWLAAAAPQKTKPKARKAKAPPK